METQPQNWNEIEACLRKPFPLKAIRFRLEGPARQVEGKLCVRAVPFVAGYAVQARLDEAVGASNWAYRWTPVAVVKGRVVTAKGALSLYGRLAKEEEGREHKGGEAGETVALEALRNCAALYGVGRYLAEQEALWVEVKSGDPKCWVLSKADEERLRAVLPDVANDGDAPAEMAVLASAEPAPGVEIETASNVAEEADASEALEEIGVIEAAEEMEEVNVAAEEMEEADAVDVAEEAENTSEVIETAGTTAVASDQREVTQSPSANAGFTGPKADREGSESASRAGVELVHSDKVEAIRWLCANLEVQELAELETMPATEAEVHFERLKRAWGEKQQQQRVSAASKSPAPLAVSPGPRPAAATSVDEVSDELWARYVQVHTDLRGHGPADTSLQKRLKASTVEGMIAALERQLATRKQQQPAGLVTARS